VIPSKENEDRTARSLEVDKEAYLRRKIVERLIGWPRESRQIFLRFFKTTDNFGGMVTLISSGSTHSTKSSEIFGDKA
jgi:hypothetical protein